MTLVKYIEPRGWDFPEDNLVKPVVNSGLTKSASMDVSDIESEEGKVKIHVIALGAGEYWGPNRNGDYFPQKALEEYHPTFVTMGHFHKNHKNKPTDPKYGKVEKSWYNPKMHRVELVVSVDLKSYPEFEYKLKSGSDIAVSMAAKLPFDLCSICGHRRTKPGREFTCKHINDELTKVYPDGKAVYAINSEPKFFDISEVWKPADRTAYVLRKVASSRESSEVDQALLKAAVEISLIRNGNSWEKEVPNLDPLDLSKPLHRTSHLEKESKWDKLAFIQKLSELEKKVEATLSGVIEDGNISATKSSVVNVNLPPEVLDTLSKLPRKSAYASLAGEGIVLRPSEFIRLNLGEDSPDISKVLPLVKGIFSKLKDSQESRDVEDFDLDAVEEHSKFTKLFRKYINSRSILPKYATDRAVVVIISKLPSSKVDISGSQSLEKESNFNREIALLYGLYKVSALHYILNNNGKHELDSTNVPAVSAILENYV